VDARGQLDAVYRATEYRVPLPDRNDLVLRVDCHDAAADRVLRECCGVQYHWVILTPCNPASQRLDEAANMQRLRECEATLDRLGLRHYRARNHDPAGTWPDEPGFLLCDSPAGVAEELGRRFGQNAVLAAALDSAPRLVWL
jgi:hypothetical protein